MCLSHHALKVLKKGLLITNFNEKIKIKNANRFWLVLLIVMRLVLTDSLDYGKNMVWEPEFSNSSKSVGQIFTKFDSDHL